jgi:hypothetical protein
MDEEKIQVKGSDGSHVELDEYNHTVTYPDGRKTDFREVTADDIAPNKRELVLGNVHVNAALMNFLVGYGSNQAEAISDAVAPVLLVDKRSDKYYTLASTEKHRRANAEMAHEEATINEVSPSISNTTFTTKAYALKTFVAQGVEAGADAVVRPRVRALSRLLNAMNIDREVRCQSTVMNATTFSSYLATKTSSNFWDTIGGSPTDSNPIGDIVAGAESMYAPLTDIVMSEKGWWRFVTNPNVYKFGLYTAENALNASPDVLAQRIGFPGVKFHIGRMRKEAATMAVSTVSYIWDDDCMLLHIPQGAGDNGEVVPTARTFRWNKDGAARQMNGYRIREWDDLNRGQDGGRVMALCCNEVIQVVATAAGYMIQNIY